MIGGNLNADSGCLAGCLIGSGWPRLFVVGAATLSRLAVAGFLCALISLAAPASLRSANACQKCERLGHEQFHAGFLGGDDYDDAMVAPYDTSHGGEATAQFVAQGGKWPQPGGLGTPVTITYSYNNLLDGGLKDINGVSLFESLLRASIEEALGLWASVAPLHFVEVADQGTNPPPRSQYADGQFGKIRFHHVYINGPDTPGQDPVAKAQAYFPSAGGNLGGDVYFDHGDPWQEMGTRSRPDVLGAAVHELGHALGLGHSDLPQANMYWVFTRTSGLGTAALHADDIAGIRSVYGAGVGSVTPLVAVPEPMTLWLVLLGMMMGLATARGRQAQRVRLDSKM